MTLEGGRREEEGAKCSVLEDCSAGGRGGAVREDVREAARDDEDEDARVEDAGGAATPDGLQGL